MDYGQNEIVVALFCYIYFIDLHSKNCVCSNKNYYCSSVDCSYFMSLDELVAHSSRLITQVFVKTNRYLLCSFLNKVFHMLY